MRRLLEEGRHVRAVDMRRGAGLEQLDVEFVEASVLDPRAMEQAVRGAAVVYHLAAIISVVGDPTGRVWATNVDGVRHTAEAALRAGVARLVHCSSIHAYDATGVAVVDEGSPRAEKRRLPVYDRSKAAGEAELRRIIATGLDAVICNPTGVIGPGDHARSRMNTVLSAMFEGRLPALVEGGFDWVDVRDVVTSLLAAERRGRSGENYLLPGHRLTLEELADVAETVTGVRRPSLTVPLWLARVFGPLGAAMSRRNGSPLWFTRETLHALESCPRVSGAKAAAELGHHPRPIEDTVRDLAAWSLGSSTSRSEA